MPRKKIEDGLTREQRYRKNHTLARITIQIPNIKAEEIKAAAALSNKSITAWIMEAVEKELYGTNQ